MGWQWRVESKVALLRCGWSKVVVSLLNFVVSSSSASWEKGNRLQIVSALRGVFVVAKGEGLSYRVQSTIVVVLVWVSRGRNEAKQWRQKRLVLWSTEGSKTEWVPMWIPKGIPKEWLYTQPAHRRGADRNLRERKMSYIAKLEWTIENDGRQQPGRRSPDLTLELFYPILYIRPLFILERSEKSEKKEEKKGRRAIATA